jgi:hypothetical protein
MNDTDAYKFWDAADMWNSAYKGVGFDDFNEYHTFFVGKTRPGNMRP